MPTDSRELPARRAAEREALLERIQASLRADGSVVAAWPIGSLGRGEGDALSDLDLWVVVADVRVPDTPEARRAFAARVGEPLVVVEAPQNAPPGGAYLLALCDGETGTLQVDRYWQPRSRARLPRQVRLVFDRAGLPHSELGTLERTPEARADDASRRVAFFWAMLLIAAKHVARRPWEPLRSTRDGVLGIVRDSLEETARLLDVPLELPEPAGDLPSDPGFKLRLLRAMAGEMQRLMPRVAERGGALSMEIAGRAEWFLELVRDTMGELDSPQFQTGSTRASGPTEKVSRSQEGG